MYSFTDSGSSRFVCLAIDLMQATVLFTVASLYGFLRIHKTKLMIE